MLKNFPHLTTAQANDLTEGAVHKLMAMGKAHEKLRTRMIDLIAEETEVRAKGNEIAQEAYSILSKHKIGDVLTWVEGLDVRLQRAGRSVKGVITGLDGVDWYRLHLIKLDGTRGAKRILHLYGSTSTTIPVQKVDEPTPAWATDPQEGQEGTDIADAAGG